MRLLANFRSALLLAAVVCVISTSAHSDDEVSGLYALVKRRIPSHSNAFVFNLSTTASSDGVDTFKLGDASHDEGDGNAKIYIECTTISACARGLYTYVTEFGGVDIWWTGSRLDQLPHKLPTVNEPITRSAIVPYRYFFNTVTFDYTTAFYTFDDWSLLLDWLALRGVNLPLAWVEAGLTDAEIIAFLSGPAFQAWNRFVDQRPIRTAKADHSRMVELGMIPVLPSFTGFVPLNGSQWGGFPSTYTNDSFLEPFDPLFAVLQKSFIDKQTAAYGSVSHIYTLDQYNENDPYSSDPTYLQNVTSATFASLRAADPEAIWLMQGWLFFSDETFWTAERVQAYLGGVPGNDSMIILDLYSEAQPQWERLSSYYGKQWVWCELHDYGGSMGFEGNFANVTAEPLRALTSPGSSMVGMGLTPEGMEGNEIIYDVLLDQAWSPTAINRTSYVSSWVSRRYYVSDLPSSAVNAWQILGATVYSNRDSSSQATVKSILELAPALTGLMLIQAGHESKSLLNIPEFKYDLVDVTRQLLANRFITLYETLVATYTSNSSSSATIAAAGQPLLQLLRDLDGLLLTDDHFLLANWIGAANSLSYGNASYAAFLEHNAWNQITLWGPTGEINDYASKQWGGLVGGYYMSRWESFVDYLVGTKASGDAYNATAIANAMLVIGEQWDVQKWDLTMSWGTVGDSWSVVQALATKYTLI
ncbi:glycoside hydrolase family 89 protein [Suillus lakei]|nr:glycoside hydrolase family 89 protein [Suillus lakei]